MTNGHSHRLGLTAASTDPTKTKTIRDTYASRLRGRFAAINAAIREGVVKNNVLGLESDGSTDDAAELAETFADEQVELHADVDRPPDLSALDEAEKMRRFQEWLTEAQESEVLEVITREENVWVRRAYERGIKNADSRLKQAGMSVAGGDAADAITVPLHERRLKTLFARNFAELNGITDAVSQQISRELATGLSEGVSPTEMARRLTDRVSKIGKTRATTLARTEIINSHTEAALQRYEQQGVDTVGIEPEVEIETAGDNDVCAECQAAAAQGPWSIDEFRGSAYEPPLHPNCRCTVLPVVSEAAAAALEAHPSKFTVMLRAGAFARDRGYYELLASAEPAQAAQLTAQAVAA